MARGQPMTPCYRCGGEKTRGTGRKRLCDNCPPYTNAELVKRRQLRHPEKVRAERNWGYKNSPERHILSGAKYRAKKNNLDFSLTTEDIVIGTHCPVFGLQFEFGKGRGKAIDASPTLDRIDNSRGYVKGNVLVVSWRANRLKADASRDELLKLAEFYKDKM